MDVLFSKQMIQRNKLLELRSLDSSRQKLSNRARQSKRKGQASLFDKGLIDGLQTQLNERHGYQLTRSSYPILSLYFEYYDLLKQVITQKNSLKAKNNRFLTQYTRYYSEEKVSQLLEEISNRNKQFRKQATLYRQQCLLKYFQFEKLVKSAMVGSLTRKIEKGKAEGLIKYEVKRSRKRDHTFFPIIEKQNKVKNFQFYSSIQTRKNITDRQNKVYYEILSLKMLLQSDSPDALETNKVCEEIKYELDNLFYTIKIKPVLQEGKKKSLLCA